MYVCRMDMENFDISRKLCEWYDSHKRDLPWRSTCSPYLIWVSEVILQQTQVAQGLDYYNRFVRRFPDVASLAAADEDEVLRYWQGLGYYSRARNMRMAAIDVMDRFGGAFPKRYEDVLSLKGIGEYTAAAIVSFAWNKPYPVVDGNVFRVLSRLFAINTPIDTGQGKKEFSALAASLLDPANAGTHNQAIMELGALVCTPRDPDCVACPLVDACLAYATNEMTSYPVKQGKINRRTRHFLYLYIICKEKTWIRRRQQGDIWTGLYEFPLIETEKMIPVERLGERKEVRALLGGESNAQILEIKTGVKHILSHQLLFLSFVKVKIDEPLPVLSSYQEVKVKDLGDYAVPQPIHDYLTR